MKTRKRFRGQGIDRKPQPRPQGVDRVRIEGAQPRPLTLHEQKTLWLCSGLQRRPEQMPPGEGALALDGLRFHAYGVVTHARCNTMTTKLRRVVLSLPPDLDKALADLKSATGQPTSQFILSILQESLPVIQALASAAAQAKTSKQQAFQVMQDVLLDALHQGEKVSHEVQDAIEEEAVKAKGENQ